MELDCNKYLVIYIYALSQCLYDVYLLWENIACFGESIIESRVALNSHVGPY